MSPDRLSFALRLLLLVWGLALLLVLAMAVDLAAGRARPEVPLVRGLGLSVGVRCSHWVPSYSQVSSSRVQLGLP